MPSLRRAALGRSSPRRTVLRSASAALLAGIAGCSGMLSGNRPTDDGEDPTSATPRDERSDDGGDPTGATPSVEDLESVSPTPTVVLQNRIDGAASVDVAVLDGGETVFPTRVDVAAGGERTVSGFDLGAGEYTLRVARGWTSAAATWEITGSEGPTPCSPSCLSYARLLPEGVDLFWVTLE